MVLKKLTRKEVLRGAVPVAALVLIASVVTGREQPSSAPQEPAARLESRVQVPEGDSDADLDLARLARPAREEGPRPESDPFSRRTFAPAPEARAEAAAAAPAPKPEAPPLPFTYLGKVVEDGKLSVFLAKGEDSYSLAAGGKRHQLDENYTVDKVTAKSVTFTYLPLKQKQTLDIPAVN